MAYSTAPARITARLSPTSRYAAPTAICCSMEPSRRTFPSQNMATTETALMRRGVSQIYLSLGDPAADGTVPVRLYFKPLVLLIWLGALIMFVGGALSVSDRRLRIGAPRPRAAKTQAPALQAAK